MNSLEEVREKINEIDAKMAALFEERMRAAKLVAEYKKEHGLPILDARREKEIIEKNALMVENDTVREYYVRFLNDVMSISKDYQSMLNNGMNVDTEN